ncbi:MAG: ATP-binding protein [Sporomusaceae bacterium]|jgi:AAA+ ATPase superfamily predicted ATPase|nr:ATP-binding protein [Sporomusaceae bacterium]
MFIGRKAELDFLNGKYNANGGQLVVLYGRRRIGKTETIREFCKDKAHIFYSCRECADEEQLKSFSARMLKDDMPVAKYVKSFTDWSQAFSSITELSVNGKKLLVIDEFPYMVRNNKSIPSILQNLWDEKLKKENVMIILCGSSMSFIENELLAEKKPLYGRATGILRMLEMGFYDAIQFFPNYNYVDKILAYAILGGVPHYLKQFDDKLSLERNIKNQILTRGSILYSEVEFLMRQELRETALYNTIIEAVALGNTKLNEIFNKTNIDKAKLSVYIKNLISLEIIQREFSINAGIKEKANTQRGRYGLTDNFFSFWYHFVFGNLSELEAGDVDGVYKYTVEAELLRYASYKFEDVCKQYLRKQNMSGNLPFRYDKVGRYFEGNVEIDLMAISKNKKQILAGECKFRNSPFDLNDFNILKAKLVNDKDTKIYYYLFSKSGFTNDLKAQEGENIRLIKIGDLF